MWINRNKYNELVKTVENLNNELKELAARPQLVDIYNDGIKLVFVLHIDGREYKIETLRIVTGGKDDKDQCYTS